MEEWVAVEDYEGLYEVSNLGKVRSIARKITYSDGRVYNYSSKILSVNFCGKYKLPYVHLYKESKRESRLLHRVVAKAFIPNSDNKTDVNHIDGDRKNNASSNLEWTTRLENMQHGFETGLINNTGINHGNNIYSEDQIQEVVNMIFLGYKQGEISNKTKVKIGTIQAIRQGKQWTHIKPQYEWQFSGDSGDL
jgi:hypothetical protein